MLQLLGILCELDELYLFDHDQSAVLWVYRSRIECKIRCYQVWRLEYLELIGKKPVDCFQVVEYESHIGARDAWNQ